MHTLISAFDDRHAARKAVERLVEAGVPRADVHLQEEPGPERQVTLGDRAVASAEREVAVGHGGLSAIVDFFASLFGDRGKHHAATWSEAVRRGHSVVVVDARDDEEAERAALVLHELGAIDVDERVTQWRAEGWSGDPGAAAPAGNEPGRLPAQRGGRVHVMSGEHPPLRDIVATRYEEVVIDGSGEPGSPESDTYRR